MFENPRRGRQAKKFYNKCSENSRSQIIFRTHIFRKLTLGAPDQKPTLVPSLDICHLLTPSLWPQGENDDFDAVLDFWWWTVWWIRLWSSVSWSCGNWRSKHFLISRKELCKAKIGYLGLPIFSQKYIFTFQISMNYRRVAFIVQVSKTFCYIQHKFQRFRDPDSLTGEDSVLTRLNNEYIVPPTQINL